MLSLPYDINAKEPGWYAVIALCAVLGILFVLRMTRAKSRNSPPTVAKINFGFALFFFCFLITRVLFVLSDFERLVNDKSQTYITLVLFGYLSSLIAIAWIAYLADSFMLERKRPILTWLSALVVVVNTVFILLVILANMTALQEIARWTIYVSTGVIFGIVILVYGSIARRGTGNLRRNAAITLIGVAIALAGSLLDSDLMATILGPLIFIPPMIMLVGLLLFALGQREV